MNKLTADKCREQIAEWERMMKDWDLSIAPFKHLQAYRIALPILEQQERVIEQVKCPFPCGWKELLRVAMNDGAFLSQKLIEGEEVRDIHRNAALSNTHRLVRVITAILDASEAAEQQERGEGWIEWEGREIPGAVKGRAVQVRYATGEIETKYSGFLNWGNGSGKLVCAYRIIPEQPTNQNGEQ